MQIARRNWQPGAPGTAAWANARAVDPGNPFGPSAVVSPNGAVAHGATSGLTGYTMIKADDLQSAAAKVKGCPILAGGGSVEVYETFEIM